MTTTRPFKTIMREFLNNPTSNKKILRNNGRTIRLCKSDEVGLTLTIIDDLSEKEICNYNHHPKCQLNYNEDNIIHLIRVLCISHQVFDGVVSDPFNSIFNNI